MSTYCTRENIEDLFDAESVKKWADLDGSGDADKIAARIAMAIEWKSAYIDDRLRGGPYEIPFSGSTPKTVTAICVYLSAVHLYGPRGHQDTDQIASRLQGYKDEAEKMLNQILAGVLRLSAAKVGLGTNAPIIVK
jgi:phage gp36-like protein